MARPQILLCWSSGKDSAWALHVLRQRGDVEAMAAQMASASRATKEARSILEGLVASANEAAATNEKVKRIVRSIDEIAFQTNILALNAAVEAARAGQMGMGFSVVADEVRNLAQRSAQAAKDTAELINESLDRAKASQAHIEQLDSTISALLDGSQTVEKAAEQVSLSSSQQSHGLQQISKEMDRIRSVTQNVAATAQQGAAAAQELSAQTSAMNQLANELQMLVGGRQRAPLQS